MTLKALIPLPALVMTVAALMLPAPAAHAIPITFGLNLSGANEVPPVSPAGTGFATVVLDPTAQTLQVSATFSGLTSGTTAAHIHCCAPLGTNAMVATLLPAFTDFPLGVTSGTYPAHTLRSYHGFFLQSRLHRRPWHDRRASRGGPDRGNFGRPELS
jgi:hypothetical protein